MFGYGYSSHCNWSDLSDLEQSIVSELPHGSGIDYDWSFERQRNGRLVLYNAYHGMDQYGFYVGSVDFSFSFDVTDTSDPHNPGAGRLQFHVNSTGRYYVNSTGLRDYLEEILFPLLDAHIVRDCPYCKNGMRSIVALSDARNETIQETLAFLESRNSYIDGLEFACWTCNGKGKLGTS
jgi:hypothetical protein